MIGPGGTLLHYRIVEKIGEGGMGVVWKATDTTLDREVAIKILPEAFTSDPDRLARFEREAKLLAALNHPNIAGIYGLHEADGARFLAMEFVEGEDLSAMLMRGPLPLASARKLGQQVALALEAAHAAGVIHRDLKPANIRVTRDGTAKVLDLGLAKALAPEAGAGTASTSMSPTMTSAGTVAGLILGTAAYMSPEQARGSPVDQRSDVWAWGAVMFEMLTGRQPFPGATVSDCIAGILKSEPPWEGLPDDTPFLLVRLLKRCLAKEPADRLHAMADIRIELQDLDAEIPGASQELTEPGRSTSRRVALTIAGLALAVLVLGTLQLVPRRVASAPTTVTVRHQTFYAGMEGNPSLSRDGSFLAYDAEGEGERSDIFLERVGGHNPINLTHTPERDEWMPAFSPDGEHIAFSADPDAGGGIFVMGATGEAVRRLTDTGFNPAWAPDGKQIAYTSDPLLDPLDRGSVSSLWVLDLASGESRKIHDGDCVQPSWSPDGRRIACGSAWGADGRASGQRDVYTILADGSGRVPITDDLAVDWNPVWSPDGSHLYFVSDRGGSMNLWRLPVDTRSGERRGELEQVQVPATHTGWISIASGGKVAYTSSDRTNTILRVPLDPTTLDATGAPEPVVQGAIVVFSYALSPDGQSLAFSSSGVQEDLYIARSDGSELRKVTDDAARDRGPGWTPDGGALVFYSTRGGTYQLWRIERDGSGARQLTAFVDETIWFPSVSPDGTTLAGWSRSRSWLFSLVGGEKLAVGDGLELPDTGTGDGPILGTPALQWSPDGRYLGGRTPGTDEVLIWDVEAREYRKLDSGAPGKATRVTGWLRDGRAILAGRDAIYAVPLDGGPSRRIARSWSLPENAGAFSLTRDAHWLYYIVDVDEADIWIAEIR